MKIGILSFAHHHGEAYIQNLRAIPQVELRLGYGLNPLYYRDTPVAGREIGRERWLASDLWRDPTLSLVDAERDLEDVKMISLMGVISF